MDELGRVDRPAASKALLENALERADEYGMVGTVARAQELLVGGQMVMKVLRGGTKLLRFEKQFSKNAEPCGDRWKCHECELPLLRTFFEMRR